VFNGLNIRTVEDQFEPKWRKMLRVNHLPYFRMSACNSGAPPFDQLTEDECINAQTRAIKIIGDEASFVFCATIREEDFYAIVGRNGFVRSPYELLVWFCLISVKEWAKADGRVSGISYFFEAGFEDHAKANNLMNKIFSDPYLKDEYRYRSHAFVEKEKSFPSQAADILAWQKCKQSVRVAAGISRKRSDFNALLERTLHKSSDLRRPQILSIISSLVKIGVPHPVLWTQV
jgi:hypothetical protein